TDYSLVTMPVTFSSGNATVSVSVAINDDSDSEPTETVTLTIDDGGNAYRVGVANTATVDILDNDDPFVSVTKIADATEGGNGTFRFTRIGDLSSSLTVNYSTAGSTATPGNDYTALTGSVTFAANAATADVTVAALNDDLLEGSETVRVTVTSGAG